MNTIMTLCNDCAKALDSLYKLKRVIRATTKKSHCCDNCHCGGLIEQYLVQDRRGKK